MDESVDFSDLVGEVITDVYVDYDVVIFTTDEGTQYVMRHMQDCCESVAVESIDGNPDNLRGEVLYAYASSNASDERDEYYCTHTWTFYRIGTVNGDLVIRWYGSSNGYYSESVDVFKYTKSVKAHG